MCIRDSNKIVQLLHLFPLDKVIEKGPNKGKPYWSKEKRPPKPLKYDGADADHVNFIRYTAILFANTWNVPLDAKQFNDDDYINGVVEKFIIPDFVPDDHKFIETDVDATEEDIQKKKADLAAQYAKNEAEDAKIVAESLKRVAAFVEQFKDTVAELDAKAAARAKEIATAIAQVKAKGEKVDKSTLPARISPFIAPEDFEKDDDTNYHVDWIMTASNLRALNYSIPPADRLETKRLAGRIMPAVATTTAAVAGLVALELVKLARGCTREQHKNSFLNLGVSMFQFVDPPEASKTEIRPGLFVTLWDVFQVKAGDLTIGQFLKFFSKKYKIPQESIDGITQGTQIVWLQFVHGEDRQTDNLRKWLKFEKGDKYVELLVTAEVKDESGEEKEKAVPVQYYLMRSKRSRQAMKRKREIQAAKKDS
eukprot:TRINITY_DN239_c0_g1_i2.p1 TRINITY_DN239_c0_g1~~TRINITY_DN239_c0_g1_i2.p1  ORF type:complete len:423 (-),score=115.91 TRINITY_DN239_c0_g1_i2:81-1349(-)